MVTGPVDATPTVNVSVPAQRLGPDSTVVLAAGDQLNEAQTLRLAAAVALLRAKKAVLDAGLTDLEISARTWVVDVESRVAQPKPDMAPSPVADDFA